MPKKVNGDELTARSRSSKSCNEIGAQATAWALADLVENRLVGMKSRGVYETPGGTILYKAHQHTGVHHAWTAHTAHYKDQMAVRFAELVYDGWWYTPLREAHERVCEPRPRRTSPALCKLKLYKGNMHTRGRKVPLLPVHGGDSPPSAIPRRCTITRMPGGFINLFGLPLKVNAMMKEREGIED